MFSNFAAFLEYLNFTPRFNPMQLIKQVVIGNLATIVVLDAGLFSYLFSTYNIVKLVCPSFVFGAPQNGPKVAIKSAIEQQVAL